ncbi:MAG: rhomboid family intramembrane serine protease [Gammaproteobacteria bacterium]|nr:rhomboid family intramembrane serine protease [Gammaproteobacteria bacterium]
MFQDGQIAAPALLALTVGISLLGLFRLPQVINKCLFRPYFFLRQKQYDTMILSGFVHADLGHLLFNMVTFYFFAFPLERFMGTIPFLILYFAGLIFSHACTYFKQRNNPEYASLGASGAISAVLFAFIVYFPTTTLMIIPIPIPIPAIVFAIGYVAYSYWASLQSRGRINHDAHLCGALSGLVFVAVSDPQAFAELLKTLGTFLI